MPSEHETVAYLVIPLLRALGWTPQRMAVEWNRVDVALFSGLPRDDKNLTVVVEAKKMNASCLSAMSQAQAYAQGKGDCHRLIVTDGLRYGVYTRNESGEFNLTAYMNLTRLRSNYPIYSCSGAGQALLIMAPEWSG
jgi:predicted type IV restriction endonuclease